MALFRLFRLALTSLRVPGSWKILLPALVYLLSPFDLIRDRLPIIGRLDDLLILGLAVAFLINRYLRGARKDGVSAQKAKTQEDVIEGTYRRLGDS